MIENREILSDFFSDSCGFEPFKASANFILVRVPSEDYAPFLLKHGIKIKSFSNKDLKDFVRITIPPMDTVERIKEATLSFNRQRLGMSNKQQVYTKDLS